MSNDPTHSSAEFDPISLEIIWSRLISIVDETAAALVRSAFSNVVREANDYACAILDGCGDSIAENTLGMPSFVGMMSHTMRHFLKEMPLESWKPGNVAITNDPWIAAGHLHDVTTAAPIFYRDRLVAFYVSVAHLSDIGGLGFNADGRSVYEEGLRIPPMWLQREWEPNADLIALIRANVRVPDEAVGDLMARATTGLVCSRGLQEFLLEQKLDDLSAVSRSLQEKAERSMRRAIDQIPNGTYRHEIVMDGYEHPLQIRVALTVRGSEILVDYEGTSPEQDRALNSVWIYTYAYTAYPIKCALDPFTPKNEGSYRPITVLAPEGSVVNPRFPAPVTARGMVGHGVTQAVLGALARVIPEKVMAECGSAPLLRATFNGMDEKRVPFAAPIFASGGMGARRGLDGLHATAFPNSVSFGNVETMEAVSPLRFKWKRLRPNSGGPGEFRGGWGEHLAVVVDSPYPATMSVIGDRVKNPAQGLLGGLPGAPTGLRLDDGPVLNPKNRLRISRGNTVHLFYPGGGGYGDPRRRESARVLRDLRDGIITLEAAQELYGVVPEPGELDGELESG